MLLAGAMMVAAGPASASIDNPSSNTAVFTLQSQASGMVADDLTNSQSPGNTIGEWPTTGGNNQRWVINRSPSDFDYYTIQNNSSGLCLEVAGGSTAEGAPVDQGTCTVGQTNQEWSIQYTGYNGTPTAQIINRNSGMFLTDKVQQGSGLYQSANSTYMGGWTNRWNLIRSQGGVPITISELATPYKPYPAMNLLVEIPNFNPAYGTQVDLWPSNGGSNQQWDLQAATTTDTLGTTYTEYRIANDAYDGECLESQGVQKPAVEDGCDSSSINQLNQLWLLISDDRGATPFPAIGEQDGERIINASMLYRSPDLSGGLVNPDINDIPSQGQPLVTGGSDGDPQSVFWDVKGPISSSGGAPSCVGYACLVNL
jgi:hypothetical protein